MFKRWPGYSHIPAEIRIVLAGTLIMMAPAILNGYPLLYPDTGTYLWSGFQRELLIGRPMGYGLFLAETSLRTSLWYALFAQCLIISLVIRMAVPLLTGKRPGLIIYISIVSALSILTGFALNASQLLPDAFTPLIGLLLMVMLLNRQTWWQKSAASVLFVFVLVTHNSHVMIVLLCLVLIALVKAFVKIPLIPWARVGFVTGLTTAALLCILGIHGFVGKSWTMSKGEHVFLLNRTREAGVLQKFLAENCDSKAYALCDYLDVLEGDFMWDTGRSPLYKLGGWDATEEEFNRTMTDMLSSTDYATPLAMDVFKSWFRQFFTWEFEDPGKMGMNSGPYYPIQTYLPEDVDLMTTAVQGQDAISLPGMRMVSNVVILLSLLTVISLLIQKKIPAQLKGAIIILLLFLVANAVVCSTFSLAIGRYQARVVWLAVFVALCWLVYRYLQPKPVETPAA